MDKALIDKYILYILEKNGWYDNRQFKDADKWIEEIEKNGYCCFDYAKDIIRELGGLSFREYSPLTYQNMIKLKKERETFIHALFWRARMFDSEIRIKCKRACKMLKKLGKLSEIENYCGATFAFDALVAALDDEIVMDIEIAKEIVGEEMFPIGSVAPDGIMYVTPKRIIYVVFDDSIWWIGASIEDCINRFFIASMHPKQVYGC